MAFHVACPITCRKICYCSLGGPRSVQTAAGQQEFLQNVLALEGLLGRPSFLASGGEDTVEVLVPRLSKEVRPKKRGGGGFLGASGTAALAGVGTGTVGTTVGTGAAAVAAGVDRGGGGSGGDEGALSITKKTFMRKKSVTMASIAAAEAAALAEHAKKAAAVRMLTGVGGEPIVGDEVSVVPQVICGLCLFGEAVGSKKAKRMLPCSSCKKQYHRKCLKHWSKNRDLFNWSSWICGSCRICEVCRRTGEPNKLMFCKRCDGAYHAYCQQPQLKHVPKGPYLCPKHTRCHSCGSRIPGVGTSSRWFMQYTNCDACGRLFMKGKYCPICLKVYRDSEATPMVCCDNCEHWVHCDCDGISDEKYQEFQIDHNLHYKCATCRGDCYRIKDSEDAIQELWMRRDESERDLVAQLQASAGILSKEAAMKLYPSSDDDDNGDDNDEEDEKVTTEVAEHAKKTSKHFTVKGKFSKKPAPFKKEIEETNKSGTAEQIKKLKITLPMRATDSVDSPFEQNEERRKELDKKTIKILNPSISVVWKKRDVGESDTVSQPQSVERELSEHLKPVKIGETLKGYHSKKLASSKKRNEDFDDKAGTVEQIKKLKITLPKRKKDIYHTSLPLEAADIGSSKKQDGAVLDDENIILSNGDDQWINGTIEVDHSTHHKLTDELPVQSWGSNNEIMRRRRMPSSKFRDMDTSVWNPAKHSSYMRNASEVDNRINANECDVANDLASASGPHTTKMLKEKSRAAMQSHAPSHDEDSIGVPHTTKMLKEKSRAAMQSHVPSHDEDSIGVPRKKHKVQEELEHRQDEDARVSKETISKVSLKLKLRKPSEVSTGIQSSPDRDTEKQEDEARVMRGIRSKRKRHNSLEQHSLTEQEEPYVSQEEEEKISDDNWILQKLGVEAVNKRIEVLHPRHRTWSQGTVTAVVPQKSQFTMTLDDGRQETFEFGKRSLRILSHSKKSSFRRNA